MWKVGDGNQILLFTMNFSINELFVLVGIIFVASELFVGIQTGFDLVLVGISLILGGSLGMLTGNPYIATIATIVLFTVYILFGRSTIKRKLVVMTHSTNIDKLIDKKGVVIRSITPDTAGMVRIDDEDWRAIADEVLYEKDQVKVEFVSGVSLKVKKLK